MIWFYKNKCQLMMLNWQKQSGCICYNDEWGPSGTRGPDLKTSMGMVKRACYSLRRYKLSANKGSVQSCTTEEDKEGCSAGSRQLLQSKFIISWWASKTEPVLRAKTHWKEGDGESLSWRTFWNHSKYAQSWLLQGSLKGNYNHLLKSSYNENRRI